MRWYAVHNKVKLNYYTGTLGVSKLIDKNRRHIPIYLTGKLGKIPVPEVIWNVVYDEKNSAGIAFIGVNNYFLRGKYFTMCRDISSELPWMNSVMKAFVYACTLQNWYQKVNYSFPNYDVKNLLGTDLVLPQIILDTQTRNMKHFYEYRNFADN